jgi:hypothetical protein
LSPYGFAIEAAGDFLERGVWTFTEPGCDLSSPLTGVFARRKQPIKAFSFLFKPLFSWNHRWAMARGEERSAAGDLLAARKSRLRSRRSRLSTSVDTVS